jgi:hypothetical protein
MPSSLACPAPVCPAPRVPGSSADRARLGRPARTLAQQPAADHRHHGHQDSRESQHCVPRGQQLGGQAEADDGQQVMVPLEPIRAPLLCAGTGADRGIHGLTRHLRLSAVRPTTGSDYGGEVNAVASRAAEQCGS